jgi:sporulation protein YlmC with PRC-barrel domain
MNTSEIIGKEVLDKNANRLGKLVDIGMSIPPGTIDYYLVKIGITKKVQIFSNNIEKVGDKVILNITRDELEKRPAAAK